MCVRLLDASWSSSHKAPRLGCGGNCRTERACALRDGVGGEWGLGVVGISVEEKAFPGDPEVGLEG